LNFENPIHRWKIFISTLILISVGMGVFSKRGVVDLKQLTKKNSELERRVELAKLRKYDLEKQIQSFENNQEAQERVVRQVLGYVRKDELVFEFN